MKIIIDENIPLAKKCFKSLGDVHLVPGRDLPAAAVKDGDVLLVRSITQVNAELLDGSNIKFVGTATIGTDHIDLEYLKENDITFTSAAGCNANSVGEYITLAMLYFGEKLRFDLSTKTVGIIGVGNVGANVRDKAKALGMTVLEHDPPKAATLGGDHWVSFAEAFAADIVTIHVSLEKHGDHPTFHMINDTVLNQLKPNQILINAARGGVIDNNHFTDFLKATPLAAVLLDVWEKEPTISEEMLTQVDLGSPHIAGYSYDGKINGTTILYNALTAFLGRSEKITTSQLLNDIDDYPITIDTNNKTTQAVYFEALRSIYDITIDDKTLRESILLPKAQRGGSFDHQRKSYRRRLEASHTTITLVPYSATLAATLKAIGFNVNNDT